MCENISNCLPKVSADTCGKELREETIMEIIHSSRELAMNALALAKLVNGTLFGKDAEDNSKKITPDDSAKSVLIEHRATLSELCGELERMARRVQ